jgi:hypothetical protein
MFIGVLILVAVIRRGKGLPVAPYALDTRDRNIIQSQDMYHRSYKARSGS